jgi:hypothetical protein
MATAAATSPSVIHREARMTFTPNNQAHAQPPERDVNCNDDVRAS